MELSKLFGLPAHPLLVHIPVVLVPLAAIGMVVIVFSAKMRDRIGWIVAGLAVAGGLGALLAAGAGEALEEQLEDAGERASSTLEHHTELGDTAKIFCVLFAVAAVAYMAIDFWLKRQAKAKAAGSAAVEGAPSETPATPSVLEKYGVPAAATAALITAGLATWWIVDAGHSGAKATWDEDAAVVVDPGAPIQVGSATFSA